MKTSKKVILFSSIFATIGLIGTTSVLLSSCGETTSVDTPNTPNIPNIPSNPGNNGSVTPDNNNGNGNNGDQNNSGGTTTPDDNANNGNNNVNPGQPSTTELTKLKSLPQDLDVINSYDDVKKDFLNFDNEKTWCLYNTDQNNLSGRNTYIVNSGDTIKLRTQMLYTQNENWNSYFTNNLNSIDSGIHLLTFKNNYVNNVENDINNLMTRAVNSVWSPNGDYMPRPYKQIFGGCTFKIPWIVEGAPTTKNNRDLSNTYDLFGPSDSDNNTRVWNYYNVTKNSGIWSTDWRRISSPLGSTNKDEFIQNVRNTITKTKVNYSNKMYRYDALYYSILNQDVPTTRISTGSGGTQMGTFRLFDNSINDFQANGFAKRRSFDDWYRSNYWDYDFNLYVDNVLGRRDTVNKVENIYLDFSKLITIDSKNTSDYNVVGSSPVISFGLNLPLLSALKEAGNLALLVRTLYMNWDSIKSSPLFESFASLVNDIYNQKIGFKDSQKYIENVKNSATNGNNSALPAYKIETYYSGLDKTNPIAGYVKVLDDYNWAINTKGNIDIDNLGWTIQKIVNDMSYWTLPYQYIIPQLFRNDIYVSYKIDKINDKYTDEYKIYDGSNKTFQLINIFNGAINNNNSGSGSSDKLTNNLSNSNLTVDLKDFVMKDPRNGNSIISKINDENNNTLNAKNIYDIATTGTTENKKLSYDNNENAIKISWFLSLNNNVNQSRQAQQFDYLSKTMLFDKKQLVNINKEQLN